MHLINNRDNVESMLALMQINNLRIAIPQNQIVTLEPREDLKFDDPLLGSVGWVFTEGGGVAVYSLNEGIQLSNSIKDCRIIVLLSHLELIYAIVVDELNMLKAGQLNGYDIPKAMQINSSPVNGVALYDGHLVCLTSAKDLYDKVINDQVVPA